jgi:hypothetical protein
MALFATYTAVFPKVLVFAVNARGDRASRHNFILAAFASPEKPSLTHPDPEMAAMLSRRLGAPTDAGVLPLTDDFAPVDRYLMSAW